MSGLTPGALSRHDAGARRSVTVALDAIHPPIGEHAFRVKVECANERLAVNDAPVVVR